MGKAKFRMSSRVLGQLLDLPITSHICGLEMEAGGECLNVVIEDPQLPVSAETPVISPSFVSRNVLKFLNWGNLS